VSLNSLGVGKTKFQCTQCHEKFTLFAQDCIGLEEVIGFAESWEEGIHSQPESSAFQGEINEPSLLSGEIASGSLENQSVQIFQEKDSLLRGINNEEWSSETVTDDLQPAYLICPKCGFKNNQKATECLSCKVVMSKFKELQSDPIWAQAPQKLKELWGVVMSHYEDEDLHQEFIRQCRKAQQLEFAASRYKKILLSQPNEELANKFRNEIVLISSVSSEGYKEPFNSETKKLIKYKVPFTSLVMLLSAIVMFVGYMTPEFRNLMGIGAAVLFVTTAIKLLFK